MKFLFVIACDITLQLRKMTFIYILCQFLIK